MVLLAFSLQDQVEKYGAYVSIACFFGLAVLSLLYFAQAREVKRLREWAGRAPERAAEIEARAVAQAEEARHVQEAPAPAPVAQPAPAPVNGAVKLKPAEVAALAFARAAGVHEPHPPRPHPVPSAAAPAAEAPPTEVAAGAPAEAPPTEVAAAGAATASGDPAAAQDLAPATNGRGEGGVPAPATPAARRAEVPPPPPAPAAAPLRATPPPRRAVPHRQPAAPARRESSMRAVIVTAIAGVLVLAAAAFALTRVLGGDEGNPTKSPAVASSTPGDGQPQATATAAPPPTKDNVRVAVYNGTVQPGLAGSIRDQLVNNGYKQDNVGADTYTPDQQRQSSVVMYQRGNRRAAAGVASALGIKAVQLIDSSTATVVQQSGKQWDVVVIVGADKSQ